LVAWLLRRGRRPSPLPAARPDGAEAAPLAKRFAEASADFHRVSRADRDEYVAREIVSLSMMHQWLDDDAERQHAASVGCVIAGR